MRLSIDTSARTMVVESQDEPRILQLYSPEAFAILADLWVTAGWELKYPYLFTWLGRPVIQLPEDLMVIQEVIYEQRPDLIIETGVAHGGSLVFYAGLCELLGKGRVIGVDIDTRPYNRSAIESHPMSHRILLIDGSSTDPTVIEQVKHEVGADETVLVVLDSDHAKNHVLAELEAYAPLVSKGSYIIATDGVMELVHDVPRGSPEWLTDNPRAAAQEFLHAHGEFVLEDPPPLFDESAGIRRATHWPGAYLRRQ